MLVPQKFQELATPRVAAAVENELFFLFVGVIHLWKRSSHIDVVGIEQIVVVVVIIIVVAVVIVVAYVIRYVHDGVDTDENKGQKGKR